MTEKIIVGFLSAHQTIGERFLFTAFLKHYKDATVQINFDAPAKSQDFRIFDGIAKIEFVENPISNEESIAQFGNRDFIWDKQGNYIKNCFAQYNIPHKDMIPYVKIRATEIEWAKQVLAQFSNPVLFNPTAANYKDPTNYCAKARMISKSTWEMLFKLNPQYTFINIGRSGDIFPVDSAVNLLDLSPREICILAHVAGKYIGIENGMLHGAIAAGAKCKCVVPTFEYAGGFLFNNWGYTLDMWDGKEDRIKYYHADDCHLLHQDLAENKW